jgi:uncharacterized protein
MTNFIPIFPLNITVFPNEKLNLHIFEPRYKQLILDCFTNKKPFGIPSVVKNTLQEFGCVVEIIEIHKTYEDGKMDIKTRGIKLFRLLELINEIPEKLYGGAIVNYPTNIEQSYKASINKVVELTRKLHQEINVTKDFKKNDEEIKSYDIAHHVGLSLEEEYEFLTLLHEDQRIEYLKRHLQKMLNELDKLAQLKQKIMLNGHFKELGGFNFTNFSKQ